MSAPTLPALAPFCVPELVGLLFERARHQLTPAELLRLADGADEQAEAMARRAAEVAEGVACLVADDGPAGVGSFRSEGRVADLLLHFSECFSTMQALLMFSGMARGEAQARPAEPSAASEAEG